MSFGFIGDIGLPHSFLRNYDNNDYGSNYYEINDS